MIGLGVSSFGHLGGIHYQNITNIENYCTSIEDHKSPIRRALLTNDEERFIRELILQWKLGRVSEKYFLDKFDISLGIDLLMFYQSGRIGETYQFKGVNISFPALLYYRSILFVTELLLVRT